MIKVPPSGARPRFDFYPVLSATIESHEAVTS